MIDFGQDIYEFLEIFKDKTNFEISMLFFMYPELNLGEIRQRLSMSRSTIHRHLVTLLKHDLIKETREEMRGNFKTKYYSLNADKWMKFKHLSPKEFQAFDDKQKINFYRQLIGTLISTLIYMDKALINLREFLQHLKKGDDKSLKEFMEPLELGLTVNFFSKTQYDEYIKLLLDLNQKFTKILPKNLSEIYNIEKPYMVIHSIIPLKKIFKNK